MSQLLDISTEPMPSSEEAIKRINSALAKVTDEKAVKIAQIVEGIVELSE